MPAPTVDSLVGKILRRCPTADYFLALDWLEAGFRTVWERRDWSWRRKEAHLRFNAVYNTGTASITRGTTTVTITGGVIDVTMVGRQWRPGVTFPIYTITSFTDATHFEIDQLWSTPDLVNGTYEIYNAFLPVASDVDEILDATNTTNLFPVGVLMTQEELDRLDPQRSNAGPPRHLVLRDYSGTGGAPRYEPWPHQKSDGVISYKYLARMPDLSDAGATIPVFLTEDVLIQFSLLEAAGWPGYEGRPNPYYRLGLLDVHQKRAERALVALEVADQNRVVTDVLDDSNTGIPGVIYDDGFHQKTDIGWD